LNQAASEQNGSLVKKRYMGMALLAVYIVLRMAADPFFWRYISEYYSYTFEFAFVALTYYVFRDEIKLFQRPALADAGLTAGMILLGWTVYRVAGLFQIPIPFDLSSKETIFLLLFLGPILEELIFRMALWQAIQAIGRNAGLTLVATTLLFAAGHFAAYWFVPAPFRGFVIYQTAYVVLLGFALGGRRLSSNAVLPCLFMHFGFNLGFLLAGKM